MTQHTEWKILNVPKDGISRLRFSSSLDRLLVSSQDKTVRYLNLDLPGNKDTVLCKYEHEAAVLDCCFSSDNKYAFSGGLDKQLLMVDLGERSNRMCLGCHENAIKCVEYSSLLNTVFSASQDCTVKTQDPRYRKSNSDSMVNECRLDSKVYAMCLSPDNARLVACTSDKKIHIFDIRDMTKPMEVRSTQLRQNITSVCSFLDSTGFVVTCIDGRVSVEYFDNSFESQSKKYAFRCHRGLDETRSHTVVYPVNCVAFHPIFGTFATGGGDGQVNIQDGANKKRIYQVPAFKTTISSLDFNKDGNILAVAASYNQQSGDIEHEPDNIYLLDIGNEAEPRAK